MADVRIDRVAARKLATQLLEANGTPAPHAAIVANHLVEASAMGLHSHGLMRISQYLGDVRSGRIRPAAEAAIARVAPSRLVAEASGVFGQVAGVAMVDALIPVARETGIALVAGRGLGHTGRVGAYPERIAMFGLIGLAACSGPPSGHWVAPFGGRQGRISTNPIACSWPVDGGAPVVADFSTGATAEGVVRSLRNRGLQAPEGMLRDPNGRPTTDPGTLYTDPRGAIQPLGGSLGYRGTALALLVEVLTTLLSGEAVDDASREGTDMTLLAIEPNAGFGVLSKGLSEHIRTSTAVDPRVPVLMPGDRELAAATDATTVLVDGPTWADLRREASASGLPEPYAEPAGDSR